MKNSRPAISEQDEERRGKTTPAATTTSMTPSQRNCIEFGRKSHRLPIRAGSRPESANKNGALDPSEFGKAKPRYAV